MLSSSLLCTRFDEQAFDDSKAAGRIANLGLQKLGAVGAELGDKLNQNADKIVEKARAFKVNEQPCALFQN